ncbi:hypothetical protein O181_001728 [Austropuccinia psidii MF-1]|uniref:Uncharacterized protein n=1 Tax=Austropuccinia psidii MF-1 TaxID=1389203 RepID=A0A9Q3BBC7_9BASI|nr:hypothetical protein [Austropuccinia psidii MF-1]
MEGVAPSFQEGRGTRRSRYFSQVVCTFIGMLKTAFKGLGEDGDEEEDSSVEEEESEDTEAVPFLLAASKGIGGPNIA